METQTPSEIPQSEFQPGSSVIYAMHGKCHVVGTEVRSHCGESIRFYKLEIKKSSLSRSNRQEPAIWVPVATAKDRGLRAPMTKPDAEAAMKVLLSREYFFKVSEPWAIVQPKLEATVRIEGGIGLAKVASFLYVLKRKLIVAPSELTKLQETIHKLLFRELSEALEEPTRILEDKVNRGFRSKMIPDS
jgi:RNA polymerase-interacting CarD/CdnL/TRCF family regulator